MFVVVDVAVVVIVLFLLVLVIIDVDTLMMIFIIVITPPPIQPSPATQQPAQNHRLCNVSRVTCHVLRVTCHVLRVTCHPSHCFHLCLLPHSTASNLLCFTPSFSRQISEWRSYYGQPIDMWSVGLVFRCACLVCLVVVWDASWGLGLRVEGLGLRV